VEILSDIVENSGVGILGSDPKKIKNITALLHDL
jgi:hypothetical protein